MSLFNFQFGFLFLTAATVLSAAFYDYRWRRIPNFITFPAIVTGLLMHGIHAGWSGVYSSLLGLAGGGGFLLIFYLMGGMGAGDVKLLGSVGALLGLDKIMTAVMITVIAGALMALGKIMINRLQHRLPFGFRNPAGEAAPEAHVAVEQNHNGAKATIPYGVAIAIGALFTLVL